MNKANIQKLVTNFVDQLHTIFQQDVIAAVTGGNGKASLKNGVSGLGRGAKRTSDDLDQISEKFVAFVAKNPGLRIEQINKQLGTTTKELALPIRKMLAEKKIKAKGKKRSTTYFA